ncbi:MAG: hypothetical protein QY325_13600 [Flavobacteriales bacterium]|nr:MAG: hypothetical protein QY325_13600 [Flavobacteriales bacterium]
MEPLTLLKIAVQAAALLAWVLHLRRAAPALRPIAAFLALSVAVENVALLLGHFTGNNTWLYKAYVPALIVLLSYWLWRSMARPWATAVIAGALAVYLGLLGWEAATVSAERLLFARSVLFGYAFISALCAAELLRLATTADSVLWRLPAFWVHLAFFASLGPAIPYLGLLNRLYAADRHLADTLFVIVDVLFLVQFAALGVAGLLLRPTPIAPAHGKG